MMTSSNVAHANGGVNLVTVGSVSHDDVEDLREAFDLFDLDRDGRITPGELLRVMKSLQIKVTDEQITEMINKVDTKGSGTVEFAEFSAMMSRRRQKLLSADTSPPPHDQFTETANRQELQKVFQVFDIDGDGLIDANELRKTMENLQVNVTEDDVRAMIKEADKNGDGKVDMEEFIVMMSAK